MTDAERGESAREARASLAHAPSTPVRRSQTCALRSDHLFAENAVTMRAITISNEAGNRELSQHAERLGTIVEGRATNVLVFISISIAESRVRTRASECFIVMRIIQRVATTRTIVRSANIFLPDKFFFSPRDPSVTNTTHVRFLRAEIGVRAFRATNRLNSCFFPRSIGFRMLLC